MGNISLKGLIIDISTMCRIIWPFLRLIISGVLILMFLLFMDELIIVGTPLKRAFHIAMESSAMSFTTIGFGDVLPNSPFGKFICVLQGLLGIVTIGILAGLFSNLVQQHLKRYK